MNNPVVSVKSYVFGFTFSIILTVTSYLAYQIYQSPVKIFPFEIAVAFIICLAVLQLIIQLIFFLHLGFDLGSRWKIGIFASTISIILLIVLGSIWIMYHLNYNMTPGQQTEDFIIQDEGIKNRSLQKMQH